MTIFSLYDKAVAEVDADRERLINEAYIEKLEARIKELEARPIHTMDVDRLDALVRALNDMEVLDSRVISKIKILRTAFGLGLKEAKDAIETGHWVVPVDEDLPF